MAATSCTRSMMRLSLTFTSSSSQKNDCRSYTHSKYDTMAPPALARMSGDIRALRVEDAVGLGVVRTVRRFDDGNALDAGGVAAGWPLECGGDEDIDRQFEQAPHW